MKLPIVFNLAGSFLLLVAMLSVRSAAVFSIAISCAMACFIIQMTLQRRAKARGGGAAPVAPPPRSRLWMVLIAVVLGSFVWVPFTGFLPISLRIAIPVFTCVVGVTIILVVWNRQSKGT